jgi:protein SCO1/2
MVGLAFSTLIPVAVEAAPAPTQEQPTTYTRSEHDYQTPALNLINAQGETIALQALLESDQPVVMQFVFSTCSTICSVLTASLAQARKAMSRESLEYRLVTISIDPEYDTPETLKAYAERFNAGDRWQFLTGSDQSIKQVLKAFDAYYPGNNKMYHLPYTYLRAHRNARWIRINGIMSAAELTAEYRAMLDKEQRSSL